jgi:hypothetical protein
LLGAKIKANPSTWRIRTKLQAEFLREICDKFVSWFDKRSDGAGFIRVSITICAIPNALVFLFVPRLWEPSTGTKFVFALMFLWCVGDGSTFTILLISSFPFIFRWWAWFKPWEGIQSGVATASDLVTFVEILLVEVLIVFGVFLVSAT